MGSFPTLETYAEEERERVRTTAIPQFPRLPCDIYRIRLNDAGFAHYRTPPGVCTGEATTDTG